MLFLCEILCLDQKLIIGREIQKKFIKQGRTGQGHIHLVQGHMAAFFTMLTS